METTPPTPLEARGGGVWWGLGAGYPWFPLQFLTEAPHVPLDQAGNGSIELLYEGSTRPFGPVIRGADIEDDRIKAEFTFTVYRD